MANTSVAAKGQKKESKDIKAGENANETSKISTKAQNIKAAIASGQYKIDINATAKSVADALM